MADTSLIFSIIARDRTSAVLNRLQARTAAFSRVAASALGPAIAPVAAVSTAAIVSLGGALVGAGAGLGVFGAVVKTSMTEVKEAATKVEDLNEKIRLHGKEAELAAKHGLDANKYLDKQAKAALELEARLANLPPATRDATMAFLDMKNDWTNFTDANKPATFGIMTSGYKLLSSAIKQLQPFFDMGAAAARRMISALQGWVDGGGLTRMAKTAGPALFSLITIIQNVARAVGLMFQRIGAAQGQGTLDWIVNLTQRWVAWASATEKGTGIQKFIDYVNGNGPGVSSALSGIGEAVKTIAQAMTPLAPISLAIAGALGQLISVIPPSVITALVGGFIAFNIAMRAWAIGTAIATAAQWAYNAALYASGIPLIIAAVVALVAVIVWLALKTQFFQTIWKAVWGFMKAVGAWFAGPFAGFFVSLWNKITASFGRAKNQLMGAINWVRNGFIQWRNTAVAVIGIILSKATGLVNWFIRAPGRLAGALGRMFGGLWSGFKGAINKIVGAWNNLGFTIGGGSFLGMNIPSFRLDTPNLPYVDTGGRVMATGLAMIHRGEEIHKPAVVARRGAGTGSGGGGQHTLVIKGDGRAARLLLELLREAIRDRGGDPVRVLSTL